MEHPNPTVILAYIVCNQRNFDLSFLSLSSVQREDDFSSRSTNGIFDTKSSPLQSIFHQNGWIFLLNSQTPRSGFFLQLSNFPEPKKLLRNVEIIFGLLDELLPGLWWLGFGFLRICFVSLSKAALRPWKFWKTYHSRWWNIPRWYCSCIRNPACAPVDVGSLFHYL